MSSYHKQLFAVREAVASNAGIEALSKKEGAFFDELAKYADSMTIGADYYENLCKLGLAGKLAKEIRLFMEVRRHEGTSREKNMLRQLELLSVLLNAAEIDFVVLKGAALISTNYYPAPGKRHISDIDLLFYKHDLDRLYQVLCNSGYEPWLKLGENLEQYWDSKHLPPFSSKEHAFRLECHYKPFESTFRFESPFTTQEVFAKAQTIQLGNTTCKVPCPEHLILSAFYHSEIFDGNGLVGTANYRAFMDVSAVANNKAQDINWDYIIEQVSKKKYDTYFYRFIRNISNRYDSSITQTPIYKNKPTSIWHRVLELSPKRLRSMVTTTIGHSREVMRANSKAGKQQRLYIAKHNPDNWKYFPLYRQLMTPSLLKKRIRYFLDISNW